MAENRTLKLTSVRIFRIFRRRFEAIAGVGAAAAVVSLIMLTRDPVSSDGHVAGARPRSGVTIAPLIAPDRACAQIAVSW